MAILKGLSKVPWWIWAIIGLMICFYFFYGRIWGMVLDHARVDQGKVVATLEEHQKMYEAEIARLMEELKSVKQQQVMAKQETEKLRGMIYAKNQEILAIKKERDSVVVPSDPDAILNEFRAGGFHPRGLFPNK